MSTKGLERGNLRTCKKQLGFWSLGAQLQALIVPISRKDGVGGGGPNLVGLLGWSAADGGLRQGPGGVDEIDGGFKKI